MNEVKDVSSEAADMVEVKKWHPCTVKPIRSGVYKVRDNQTETDCWWSYWDNDRRHWGMFRLTAERALTHRGPDSRTSQQDRNWQGLTIEEWMEAKGCVERGEEYD